MRTTHTITVTYPLAGNDDGLPVEIRFTYEPTIGRTGYYITFSSVVPLVGPLPAIIRDAITSWAKEWLDDDDGQYAAWDQALDDTERQRQSARDMGMIRS